MFKNISIRVAQSHDYDAVLEFLREFYYKEEPITVAHPIPGNTTDDEQFTMSGITYGSVLIAIDNESEKMVGALSAGPIKHGNADAMIEDAKSTETEKWKDIMLLLAYIEKKSDIFQRFDVSKALYIHAIGVHHEYRGQGIGERLFDSCFKTAKNLNYSIVTADCSSVFSVKIAEKIGMEEVSSVTYDEYNGYIGHNLFKGTAPNMEIRSFVKRIE